jgi:hypothetical protein
VERDRLDAEGRAGAAGQRILSLEEQLRIERMKFAALQREFNILEDASVEVRIADVLEAQLRIEREKVATLQRSAHAAREACPQLRLARDEGLPLEEQIRRITYEITPSAEPLDFRPAALALGCTESEAERLDTQLARADRVDDEFHAFRTGIRRIGKLKKETA